MAKRLTDYLISYDPYETDDGRDKALSLIERTKRIMNISSCNKCKYCLKALIPTEPFTWNFKCYHPSILNPSIISTYKIIKFKVESPNEFVEAPSWCPLKGDNESSVVTNVADEAPVRKENDNSAEDKDKMTNDTTINNGPKRPKRWSKSYKPATWDIERALEKLKPNVDFKTIEIGDVIHIPPTTCNDERLDIKVTCKTLSYIAGPVVGNEKRIMYVYDTGYKRLIMSKVNKNA